MSVYGILGLVFGPFAVVYLLLTKRSIRVMRAGDEEWRQRWRQLPASRRKAILRRMKSGQAVEREDAELSMRAVRQIEHVRKATQPITIAGAAALGFILIAGIVSGATILIACAALGLSFSGMLTLLSHQRRRRYHQSLTATERTLEQ